MRLKIINHVPKLQITTDEDNEHEIVLTISKDNGVKLEEIQCGDTIRLGDREFIVLEQNYGKTSVVAKQFAKTMAFGEDGNYLTSNVRTYCTGEFYSELTEAIGKENIIPHVVNLDADDGTGDHIECTDYVSILTRDQYRQYRKFLPAYGEWWWTATRVNADDPSYARDVCCVYSNGILSWDDCDYSYGVRPFCILNSSILVS